MISSQSQATIGFLKSAEGDVMFPTLFTQVDPIEASIQIFDAAAKERASFKVLLECATSENAIFNPFRVHWKHRFSARHLRNL